MRNGPFEAIVIGASAGAVETLLTVLPQLPQDYPVPIMIVVHVPPDKKSVLADVIGEKCALKVREAEDKDELQAGYVYFAPPDYHLLVEADRSLALTVEEPVLFSRPSIDVLFESAADIYRDKLLAIVLTGANTDGAAGLRCVLDQGGTGIVQDPATAQAAAMPEAALKACPDALMFGVDQIVSFLLQKGASV